VIAAAGGGGYALRFGRGCKGAALDHERRSHRALHRQNSTRCLFISIIPMQEA
jgi:hypothetical protein